MEEVLHRLGPVLPAMDFQGLWRHAKENRPTTIVGWLTWGSVGLAGTTVCSAALAAALGFLFFLSLGLIGFISIASIVIGTWLSVTAFLGFFAMLGLGSLTLSAALAQLVVNAAIKYVPVLYASVYRQMDALEIQSYLQKHVLPHIQHANNQHADKLQPEAASPTVSVQQAAPPKPAPAAPISLTDAQATAAADIRTQYSPDAKHVTISEPAAVSTRPASLAHTAMRNLDTSNGSSDQLRPLKERVV